MKKHVTIVNYTGRKGGGPLDAIEMAKALARKGAVIVPVVSRSVENIDDWITETLFEKVIVIDTYGSKVTLAINSILFSFKQKKIIIEETKGYVVDTIYCPMVTFWTNKINRLFPNAKVVVVNHDPVPHSGANNLIVRLNETIFKKADIVVVHSRRFLEYAKKQYKKAIYFPLGEHSLYKNKWNNKTIINYDPEKVNFLFFGRIADYKGLDCLGQAFAELEKKYPGKVALYVVGGGDFSPYNKFYEDVVNFELINRWIGDNEVAGLYCGENIVTVCPYKNATQSGAVLVSYSFNAPVIVSDAGGLVEQVENRKTGIIFKASDYKSLQMAMAQFADNHTIIKEMRIPIKDYLQSISWDSSAEILLKTVKSL